VFELLQNCDNNKFRRARVRGVLPFVSFQVYPDRIVVECNEDGFTVDNLNAICSISESTKSASHGYIGAKGIGFKSVFIAAWKAEIQSGNFSFYFKHEQGDLGLGMVIPVWMETESSLQDPVTRMTLRLHQKGDPAMLENLRKTIFRQLEDLQQTCLLFLHNIKQIRVSFFDEEENMKKSNEFSVKALAGHRVDLETVSVDQNSSTTVRKQHYHVTRHEATNLSRSVGRKLAAIDGEASSSSTAEVVLAFPLTDASEPLLDSQHIFAFLPIRETAFKVRYRTPTRYSHEWRILTDTCSSSSSLTSTPRPVVRIFSQIPCATRTCAPASPQLSSRPSWNFPKTRICATTGHRSSLPKTTLLVVSGTSCQIRSAAFSPRRRF
jgi:hypothetical protein